MVAQLRVVFVPNYTKKNRQARPFAYVQPLRIAYNAKGKPDPAILMYRLMREYRSDGTRKGVVFPLEALWRRVEMVPKIGKECNPKWTCDTAVEEARELYLNCTENLASFIELY